MSIASLSAAGPVSLSIIHVAIPYTYTPAVGQATVPVQQTVGVKCVVAEHRGNDHSLTLPEVFRVCPWSQRPHVPGGMTARQ